MKFGVQICNICIARSPYTVSGAGSSVASSTMAAENMLTSQKYKTLKKWSIWACQQIQQTRESSVRTWDNKQQ